MKARPILFSGPMVRALLAGTKTQTRRIAKGAPHYEIDAEAYMVHGEACFGIRGNPGAPQETFNFFMGEDGEYPALTCPYGVPGDLLWVKERLARTPDLWTYVADGAEVEWPARRDLASKRLDYAPSIHMPKVASRLTLDITDVRVERLQDISEADAIAEGITEHPCTGPHRGPGATYWTADGPHPDAPLKRTTPVRAYQALWEEINGEESWAANPFVWSLTFVVHHQNVDALIRAKEAA